MALLLLNVNHVYYTTKVLKPGWCMKVFDEKFEESLNRLKEKIFPASSVLIIPHDFPDPDSMGQQWGHSFY